MAKRIYDTAQWRKLRKHYLTLFPTCEMCRQEGRVVAAQHVDHIKPIAEGGAPFDMTNLQSLCATHHSRKTILRDGGFGRKKSNRPLIRGCDAAGQPIDPEHPWNRGTKAS